MRQTIGAVILPAPSTKRSYYHIILFSALMDVSLNATDKDLVLVQ